MFIQACIVNSTLKATTYICQACHLLGTQGESSIQGHPHCRDVNEMLRSETRPRRFTSSPRRDGDVPTFLQDETETFGKCVLRRYRLHPCLIGASRNSERMFVILYNNVDIISKTYDDIASTTLQIHQFSHSGLMTVI